MKSHEPLPWLRARRSHLGATAVACAIAAVVSAPVAQAKEGVRNLGGGLEQLAVPAVRAQAQSRQSLAAATAEEELTFTPSVQFDDAGRALVRIALDGKTPAAMVLESLKGTPNVEVVASDLSYRSGMVEAYVPTDALASLAAKRGVLSIVPSAPMVTNVGATTSQGVVQHRVNKLPAGVDGSGITVGVISDSYNTLGAGSAEADIASGDLPGAGNPTNAQPVVVLQDGISQNDIDEGRAMLQIVHDMAPQARLGFATANGGQLNFADNIRSLAGVPGAPHAVAGFRSDVIVDDVIYPDEPMFQDGIIAQAVDEVVARGISYFSSAGNRPATQAYDSKVRIVPGVAASWAGTNLNFGNVPPDLYAGGFHDFNASSGAVDIAQTVAFAAGNTFVFQWNEPFDPIPPTPVGAPIVQGSGTVPPNGDDRFTFNGTAGQIVEIFVDADPASATPNPDLTLALLDPDGNEIDFVDTGTNPESLTLALPETGIYTVVVDSFLPAQFGGYIYRVQEVEITEQVLSDYNILFFLPNGTFIGAFAEQNRFTNRPLEIGGVPGTTLQVVVARANVPDSNNRNVADRIRYVGFNGVNPQEYFSYLDPVTYGHNSAAGANGVAAYAFFPPFVPENFTSPGPSTIYFDKNNRRFKHPQIRLKPDMAAMDGANTTFFLQDSSTDPDTFPNFFGTSAAAPHAAAIAALVLDAAGGPGSIGPKRMREILQDSAFRHDLDPYFSSGFALTLGNALAITAQSDFAARRPVRPERVHAGSHRLPQPRVVPHQRQQRRRDASSAGRHLRRAAECRSGVGTAVHHRQSHGRAGCSRHHGCFLDPGRSAGGGGPVEAAGSRLRSRIVPQRRPVGLRRRSRRTGPGGHAQWCGRRQLCRPPGSDSPYPGGYCCVRGCRVLRHLPGRRTVPGPVLQPDRQGLQPARRLRLRQCRGSREGGFEEEELGRFSRLDEARTGCRCGPCYLW